MEAIKLDAGGMKQQFMHCPDNKYHPGIKKNGIVMDGTSTNMVHHPQYLSSYNEAEVL